MTNVQHQLQEGAENNYTISISSSQALHPHTTYIEWIIDSSYTHYIDKYASLLFSSSEATKNKIFVAYDYALIFASCRDIEFWNVLITNVYHVPNLFAIFFVGTPTYQGWKKCWFVARFICCKGCEQSWNYCWRVPWYQKHIV